MMTDGRNVLKIDPSSRAQKLTPEIKWLIADWTVVLEVIHPMT